ncbi:unnamed protein product [Cyprideis torosa]|uniref:Uncharacterized protein n=1 Tax=Cyprideis torosa TaxID=163714 RepID=A0A7R8ZS74_9CRUS|nr:unnamed protein product [Cyprideis torosa]CAG0905270.1 unnamed protein product [Cyprideis torosa]
MSNTRAEAGNRLLLPLAAGVAAMFVAPPSLLHPALELTLLYALTLHATLAHLHFGVCVVRQMAQHLNIPVFSIRTKSQ